jgi:tryptophan synthase alpha chain
MSRIEDTFARLRAQGRKALIPYITAGDPTPAVTVPLMRRLVEAGANILELGVPFSDPMADGPVIQRATERALVHRVSLTDVLGMVREFRRKDQETPVVLMGYLNPVEVMGYARFAREAVAAGVDGVLTVDLPPEEAEPLVEQLRKQRLDAIFLLAPTSGLDRIQTIASTASGFIYYVSLRGVTGAAHLDVKEVAARVKDIRAHTGLPIGVGFGIRDPESAAQVARVADAVVVGSAVVKRMEERVSKPKSILTDVPAFVASLREAMDGKTVSVRTAGGRR